MMTHRWEVTGSKAGRLGTLGRATFGEGSLGFYWWFWLPTARTNGGKLSRNECMQVTLNWLCFWVSMTAWPLRGKPHG